MISGIELTKYHEDQKVFKERYGKTVYEKQKSVDGRGDKKRHNDTDTSRCYSEDDGLKQDDKAEAFKQNKLASQEVERQ